MSVLGSWGLGTKGLESGLDNYLMSIFKFQHLSRSKDEETELETPKSSNLFVKQGIHVVHALIEFLISALKLKHHQKH